VSRKIPSQGYRVLIYSCSRFRGEISAIITASVAERVGEEMLTWGTKYGAKFVTGLEHVLEANDAFLEEGRIQLENS
jgi:hypothetical protein